MVMIAKNPSHKADNWAPWQQEAQEQLGQERQRRLLPRCNGCGEPVETERRLELERFGVRGVACEDCVAAAWKENWMGGWCS